MDDRQRDEIRRIDAGIDSAIRDSLDLSDYLNKRNRSVSLDDFNNAGKMKSQEKSKCV